MEDLSKIEDFTTSEIEKAFNNFLTTKEIGFGQIGPALRLAVSGKGMGPSLFEICEILGKETTINRINKALTTISK